MCIRDSVCTESYRVAKEASHSAELAAVWTPATGFNRNESKRSPAGPMSFEHRGDEFRDQIELIQIHRSPGNGGVRLEAGFSLLTIVVYRLVDLLEFAICGILDYLGPGFVGLTKSHGISVTGST